MIEQVEIIKQADQETDRTRLPGIPIAAKADLTKNDLKESQKIIQNIMFNIYERSLRFNNNGFYNF